MKRQTTLTILGALCLFSVLFSQTQINSNSSDLQLFPKVAYTEGGRFLFTWVSNHAGQAFEIYSRSTNSSLTPSGSDATLSVPFSARDGHRLHAEVIPSIKAATSDTGAIVAWVDHKNNKVEAIRITNSATVDNTFHGGDPLVVHPANPTYVYTPPQMCEGPSGGAYFAWLEGSDLKVRLLESDGGWAFNAVTVANGSITLPRICADGDGGAKIAWVEYSSPYWRVYMRGVNSGGSPGSKIEVDAADWPYYSHVDFHRWADLNLIHSGDRTILTMKYRFTFRKRDHPIEGARQLCYMIREYLVARVVRDSDNHVYGRIMLDTVIYDDDDFADEIPHVGCPISRETYSCLTTPTLTPASNGGAYLTWSQGTWNRSTGSRNNDAEIFVAKINSSGSEVWTQWISATGCAYGFNNAPRIVGLDNNANAAVIWQNYDRGLKPTTGEGRVYVSKITDTGSFTTPQAVGSSANAWSFDAVSTGSGVVVGWSNKSGGDWDIHAEKITSF